MRGASRLRPKRNPRLLRPANHDPGAGFNPAPSGPHARPHPGQPASKTTPKTALSPWSRWQTFGPS